MHVKIETAEGFKRKNNSTNESGKEAEYSESHTHSYEASDEFGR
jgi:hypothetical protein